MRFRTPFDFPRQIRLGILLLSLLIIGLQLFICFFDFSIFAPDQPHSLDEWRAFKAEISKAKRPPGHGDGNQGAVAGLPAFEHGKKVRREGPSPQRFDPNRLGEKGWVALGFSSAQARSILRYKHSLGGFKSKAQLRRSYVISAERFRQIEPFIRFSSPVQDRHPTHATPAKRSQSEQRVYRRFDLNAVSWRDLKAFPPLRRVARGLVKYRTLLGGYARFSQLREVYDMDSVALRFLKRYARIDPRAVHKIDLNRVDFKTLLRHPYFDYDMVVQIFRLRRQGGHFESLEPLRNLPAFRGKDFAKIRLYLKPD